MNIGDKVKLKPEHREYDHVGDRPYLGDQVGIITRIDEDILFVSFPKGDTSCYSYRLEQVKDNELKTVKNKNLLID